MPPAGRYLLDTNILIALLAAEPSITTALRAAGMVFIPSIALGELFYGAENSGRPAQNTQAIVALSALAAVLPCGIDTARRYGQLKSYLKARGTPIPENDIWIAALAVEHELTLVTRDAHFGALPEVRTVAWG